MSARDGFPHRLANFALPLRQVARELDRRIENPMIDGPPPARAARPAPLAPRTTKPSHVFYHDLFGQLIILGGGGTGEGGRGKTTSGRVFSVPPSPVPLPPSP